MTRDVFVGQAAGAALSLAIGWILLRELGVGRRRGRHAPQLGARHGVLPARATGFSRGAVAARRARRTRAREPLPEL